MGESVDSGILGIHRKVLGIWVLRSTIGLSLGLGLSVLTSTLMGLTTSPLLGLAAVLLMAFAPGIALGASQWILLRELKAARAFWILATATGFVIGLIAFLWAAVIAFGFLAFTPYPEYSVTPDKSSELVVLLGAQVILACFFGGMVLGLSQALCLRGGFKERARWVVAATIGFGLGLPIMYLLLLMVAEPSLPDPLANIASRVARSLIAGLIAGAVLGALGGATTGYVLRSMLKE